MRSTAEKRSIKNPKTHIYTGNGKGKTTAALGMALRAAGCGFSVAMIQFLKDSPSGELAVCKGIKNFKILRFQKGHKGFTWQMDDSQKKALAEETEAALAYAEELMAAHGCDLLILDEILGCLSCGLVELNRLLHLTEAKTAELVFTGRDAPPELIAAADYVSEIKTVKHPAESGLSAREGIEF